jgi:hypothetical protein
MPNALLLALVLWMISSVTYSAAAQTSLAAAVGGYPDRWMGDRGDWKVTTTGRLESLPYASVLMPAPA